MASRGCAYKCSFCASPYVYKGKVRMRSPENVIAEMKYLIDRCAVREIKFLDDNIALKKEYLLKLCRLIGENIKVPWACSTGLRATSIDEEIVASLKKAGCYNFNIGVESGNDSILKSVCKQETTADYLKAVKLAKKYGMICGGFFIFGLPGETKKTMNNTIKFAKDSDLDIAMFNILDVLPGSALWKELNFEFDRDNLTNSYSQPRYLPDGLTSKDIIKTQKKALIEFYGRLKIVRRLLPFLKLSPIMYVLERIFKK
ncbi:MAG: radical SAM protein, partial [Endomicrobiaceae bacterium]|nr:radical SAM protein [Endomicrobiaceae bacterium]